MKSELIYSENSVVLKNQDSFDIEQILECGQCFRFEKISEKCYDIIAFERKLRITQVGNEIIFFPSTQEDFENIWFNYFDLGRDYSLIKEELAKTSEVMAEAVKYGYGIRLLNQEPWETIISFIISQNNNIPRIKGIISNKSKYYGTKITDDAYAFPNVEQLIGVSEQELMERCKVGFRAKYIRDAVEKIHCNNVCLDEICELPPDEIRERLMTIKGIGPKVADCVLVFAFAKDDFFPVDVWIKRIVQHFFFDGEDVPVSEIHDFAKTNFGNLARFAQQYLFYYARSFPEIFEKR